MVVSSNIFAGFMDDLQWCDVRSVWSRRLIRCLSNEDKVASSLREAEHEMPLAIRKLFPKKGKERHLEGLEFLDGGPQQTF